MTGPSLALLALLSAGAEPAGDLMTVAEASGWQATATHAQVVELLDRIADGSGVMRLGELGRTVEGRSIPIAILADPPVGSAAEARESGKPVVFAFGAIHAGEVCGKEALLMLARELASEPGHPLLDHLIVVLAPVYNGDGNDRMSPDNRPGQDGPALGMGERENAQGLDLNRDWVKLESPEARALVGFLTEWDPLVTIDTHTTNGSKHRYVLTYAAPLNPSGAPGPIEYVRDRMLPHVGAALKERTGYDSFFYGNFNADRTAWESYSAMPRFGCPYRGLRGQMSILSEAYAYAPYRDRVLATLEFVREILSYTAAHRAEMAAIADEAQRQTIEAGAEPQPHDVVGIRHRLAALAEPATLLAYAAEDSQEPAEIRVIHRGRFEPTLSVSRPWAYVLPPGHGRVAEKLRQHGLILDPWSGRAAVEVYEITGIDRAADPFQGHGLVLLEARASLERRDFPEGTLLVRTAQPLGTLAVYLLEPESEDGLAAWNFFDESLALGGEYPVCRIRHPGDLAP